MKILHLAPYSPVPPVFGGALRIYHLLKGLSQRHDVTFVTFGTEEDLELITRSFGDTVHDICVVPPNQFARNHSWWRMLRALGRSESLYSQFTSSSAMQDAIDLLCRENRFDVTLLEFPHMGKFDLPGNTVRVLDEHNVEYENFERMYRNVRSPARKLLYFRECRLTFREEMRVCRGADAILATSLHDTRILDRNIPDIPKFVVPNGVDLDYFAPSGDEVEPYSMVFTGTLDYLPNQDAMLHFLHHIFPLIREAQPRAKVHIVGKNPPRWLRRLASDCVNVTGYVDDVRPYTAKAAVYIVPLRMGSGTRLKILEGMAMEKAIVSTTIGCEGIDVSPGSDILIADDPASFANEVLGLFADGERARRLGAHGRDLVRRRYDWGIVISSLETVLASLMKQRAASVSHRTVVALPDRQTAPGRAAAPRKLPPIKVLMYHRIVEDSLLLHAYSWCVMQSQFRRQLLFLKRWGFTAINFEDLAGFRQGTRPLPRRPVILTFDDGYDGVFHHALPVMRESQARGTAFVLGDRTIRTNQWDEPAGFEGASLMDNEKILELRQSGFEIGSHSMSHPDLTRVKISRAWDEIVRSKDAIEELVGTPVISFAYPFGASSRDVEELVMKAGYLFGCGVYSGPPKFSLDDYNIRRIPVTKNTNIFDFAMKILTPYEYYQWLRWEAGEFLHTHRTKGRTAGRRGVPKIPEPPVHG